MTHQKERVLNQNVMNLEKFHTKKWVTDADYTVKESDVLCLFRITPQIIVDPIEVAKQSMENLQQQHGLLYGLIY